ncbi:MAG: hypothetical protein F9K18_03895 [Thermoanaerobaculia bacterium]|nr:MAG: hypothetical protein F9K18_03895 [Thermoanaerobaculia bacterium]
MRSTPRFCFVLALLTLPATGLAQTPGDLDPAFGSGGVARIDVGVGGQARHNVATGLAVQPDGKLVLGGAAIRLPGDTGEDRMAAVRLTPSGALDPSFGSGGRVRVDAFPGDGAMYYYGRVAIGPGGEVYLHNGANLGAIGWVTAKLTPGGVLATGFGEGGFIGYLSDYVSPADVVVQPDGKLLVLSDYNDEGGIPINQEVLVERYLPNGTPDASFGDGGYCVIGFNQGDSWEDYAHAMVLQRDGKILVTAEADVGGGAWNDFAVARLTADGQLDSTFSGNGMVTIGFDLSIGANDVPYALAVDARGRILVGGVAGSEAAVVRLLPNGTLDPSFSGDGRATFHFASAEPGAYDQIFGLAVQGDGAVVAVGRGTNAAGTSRRFGVARLTEAGALDPTFAGDGTAIFDFSENSGALSVARAVALLEDGSILAVGGTELALDDMAFVAARLHNDYVFADGFDLATTGAWSSTVN